MPSFDTPQPISVTVEIGVGNIRIAATDRPDTVVEVLPTDAGKKADVSYAEQTRVEYAGGRLLVKAPKGRRYYGFRSGRESIEVQIDVPAGSELLAEAGVANLRCSGRLGECHAKVGVGEINLDEVGGPVELRTGFGDITVAKAGGQVGVTTGSGVLRVGVIEGPAVIKNSNGDAWIGEVTGDLRVSSANGRIAVDRAESGVAAKTAMGDIRLGEVAHGVVNAHTAMGKVDVGIRDGVTAWLDLSTSFGSVRNDLDAAGQPQGGRADVEVTAKTAMGDVTVRRVPALRTVS